MADRVACDRLWHQKGKHIELRAQTYRASLPLSLSLSLSVSHIWIKSHLIKQMDFKQILKFPNFQMVKCQMFGISQIRDFQILKS